MKPLLGFQLAQKTDFSVTTVSLSSLQPFAQSRLQSAMRILQKLERAQVAMDAPERGELRPLLAPTVGEGVVEDGWAGLSLHALLRPAGIRNETPRPKMAHYSAVRPR